MKKPVSKTPLVKLIPLLVRGVAPATAITIGLAPATTVSAPGDLDVSFGDFGRVAPMMDFEGPAWSAQAVGTDGTLLAGGEYCDYYCAYYHAHHTEGYSAFLTELSGAGSRVAGFATDTLHFETFGTALLADGSVIAAGTSRVMGGPALTVAKLTRSGALDTSFGTGGIFRLETQDTTHSGKSVTVDPDGRIVVAGSQGNPPATLVVRLHANGSIDESFGNSGVYTGPVSAFSGDGIKIFGTGGGYRIATSGCTIFALTTAGKLDATFGTAGIANSHPGSAMTCSSAAVQPDGRLLAVGGDGSHGYATRVMPDGTPDATFSGSALNAGTADASAVAVAADASGTIVVAGSDPAGTPDPVVLRLTASGQLDTTFGRAGTTKIDLPSEFGTYPFITDLLWRTGGAVVAVGGATADFAYHPFAVRLLGDGGADVGGVLGVSQPNVTTNEQSNEAIVKVQRTGGASGTVSVSYRTIPVDANSGPATSGQDFTAVAGRLTWHDGDSAEQEIHVPILADSIVEESEYFRVRLSDPAGGAGLGTRDATVEIQPDGSPYGLFSVYVDTPDVAEGEAAQFEVSRDYYTSGAVSVTLTPVAGTASAGTDFDPTPVTVSWADGEGGPKVVKINIAADEVVEPAETFSVKLSSPTGGALIGPHSAADVSINANAKNPKNSGGGGGDFGVLGLLLLGAAKLLQSAWSSAGKRALKRS